MKHILLHFLFEDLRPEERIIVGVKGKKLREYAVASIEAAEALIANHLDCDVYVSVAPSFGPTHRKDKIARCNVVHCDIDCKDRAQALQRLDSMALPPSFIMDSGGGYHVYWKLRESVSVEEVEAVNRAIGRALEADASTFDASRLLRVDGTRNFKPERANGHGAPVVSVVRNWGGRFALADLQVTAELVTHVKLRALLTSEDASEYSGDLSRRDMAVVGILRRAGMSDEGVLAAFLSREHLGGAARQEKHHGRKNWEKWLLKKTVSKADKDWQDAQQSTVNSPSKPELFDLLSWADERSAPPKEWLIKNLAGAGDLVMVFGAAGTGKTFLVLDLLMACLTGTTWVEEFGVSRPLSVLYCTDEGLGAIPSRLKAVADLYEASPADLRRYRRWGNVPQLFDAKSPTHISQLFDRLAEPPDVLIIDTLTNASLGGDENSNGDAGIEAAATKIARAKGTIVILVHHAGKNGDYRGASAWRGHCDTMIELVARDTTTVMSCFKSKDAAPFAPKAFNIVDGTIRWCEAVSSSKAETLEQQVLAVLTERRGQRLTAREIFDVGGFKSPHVVKMRLKKLHDSGIIKREGRGDGSKNDPFKYFVEEASA